MYGHRGLDPSQCLLVVLHDLSLKRGSMAMAILTMLLFRILQALTGVRKQNQPFRSSFKKENHPSLRRPAPGLEIRQETNERTCFIGRPVGSFPPISLFRIKVVETYFRALAGSCHGFVLFSLK